MVELLLEHKANVNCTDKDGCSALTIACREGYYDIVIALLDAGAYINVQVMLIIFYDFINRRFFLVISFFLFVG